MLGAIVGDIVGSRFEFHNHRDKEFELFTPECKPTDDSIMTLAIGKALLDCGGDYSQLSEKAVYWMRTIGRHYPRCGYAGRFNFWIFSDVSKPYNSLGNGAAMRVSACGWFADNLRQAKELSRAVTEVTHNHPEGLKGAEAVTIAVFLARTGSTKDDIRRKISEEYYTLDFTLDGIRPTYRYNMTCMGTVPQAIEAFLESTGFEDAVRCAVSVGGDSDTLAAITGSIAEAFYGIPDDIKKAAMGYLDDDLAAILTGFETKFEDKFKNIKGV